MLTVVAALAALLTLHSGCGSSESCTVTNNADGTATIECPDGSKVQVATPGGGDDLACTIADNGNGTSTITCDDGTTATVSTGADATCTITDAGDGARLLSCSDGTEALIPAPGCTSERIHRHTYSFMVQHCPGTDPVYFGTRHIPTQATPQVVTGVQFACALHTDGRAGCWGNIAPAPDTRFVQIAAGQLHACGLKADGTAQCWGHNAEGQLTVPANETFVQLALGRTFSCGLRVNGTLGCWGEEVPVPPGETFIFVAAQNGHVGNRLFGMHDNGTVLSFNIEGSQFVAFGGQRFLSWGTGQFHGCGVRPDSTVGCVGTPAPTVAGDGWAVVDGGGSHGCGLRVDGTAACWGTSGAGATEPPAGQTFVSIASDTDFSCAIRENNTVACWGTDGQGQSTPQLPFVCLPDRGAPGSTTAGVAFELWETGTISSLPNFETLGDPVETGVRANFGPPVEELDRIAMRQRAWVNLTSPGPYWFRLTSDDGSRLVIDGKRAVNHDGNHGVNPPKTGGPFCIDAGWHELVVEYYEGAGEQALVLEVSTDGTTFAPFPDANLVH